VVLVDELDVGVFEAAAPLDVHRLRAVDHDLRDAGIVEEAVDRAVAGRVVDDVTDQLGTLRGRQRDVLVRERFVDLLGHQAQQLIGVDVVVGQLRTKLVDDRFVDAQAHLFDP
jgi:hypothetical protein